MQNRASRDPPALAMTMASSDAMEVARKAFEMAETLISENDELWEPLGVTQGFTAMKRKKQFVPVENNGIAVIRASGEFNHAPLDIQKFIWQNEYRKKWDSHNLFVKIVEDVQLSEEGPIKSLQVVHQGLSLPFPVSNRDFCLIRSYKVLEGGVVLSVGMSTEHKSCPESSSYVRGRIVIDAMKMVPTDKGCTVVYCAQADPRGSIPTFVVNMGASQVPATVAGIGREFSKIKK